jgi:hypothetical protein
MATYSYERTVINNLQLLLARVEHDVGVSPTGASTSTGGVTSLDFDVDLTAPQKAALDALMLLATPDDFHASAGTRYRVRDIQRVRAAIRTQFGINFWVYPAPEGDGYRIIFDQVLTSQQRNNFRNVVWDSMLVDL